MIIRIRAASAPIGALGLAALSACLCGGCATQPTFPAPVQVRAEENGTIFAFATSGGNKPDYWEYQNSEGRKHAIAYAEKSSSEPGPQIDLDAVSPADCPHFLIALDGVPFDLVQELYDQGSFRLFRPPSRVLCCYPSMTDLALAQLFHTDRCPAYQARHFDRQTQRVAAGNADYLEARNSPWVHALAYRCSFWWDALVYLDPQVVFNHEMKGILDAFRRVDSGEAFAYSVGSAGLGTRGGRDAILKYLCTIDRLCEQIVFERHGRVKLTVTADHGHNLTENRRIQFDKTLAACGYRLTDVLKGPRDVAAIAYGLVTYAELYTADPAGVAGCLLGLDDVEFACYPEGNSVVVRDRDGAARITKGATGFIYDASGADPLRLAPILTRLREAGEISPEGEVDPAALFDATLDHDYPDPLSRVWTAFHGLVDSPPDLIVNLRDGACYGSGFFHFMVGKMTSTHGSLNRMNSTTFVLTTLGELPPVLRTPDVLPALEALRGSP